MTAAGGNHCPVGVMRGLKQRHPSSPRLIISSVSDKEKGKKKNMISPQAGAMRFIDRSNNRISYLHAFANDARACDVMTAI